MPRAKPPQLSVVPVAAAPFSSAPIEIKYICHDLFDVYFLRFNIFQLPDALHLEGVFFLLLVM